jgi:hypothetical protein
MTLPCFGRPAIGRPREENIEGEGNETKKLDYSDAEVGPGRNSVDDQTTKKQWLWR